MDLQMVEDDYIHNAIQVKLQKPISHQSEAIAPKLKIAMKAAKVIVVSETISKISN